MKKYLFFCLLIVCSITIYSQDFGFDPLGAAKLIQEMEVLLNGSLSSFSNSDIVKYKNTLKQLGNLEGTDLIRKEDRGKIGIWPYRKLKIYGEYLNEVEILGDNLSKDKLISFHPRFVEIVRDTLGGLAFWIMEQFVYNENYRYYWDEHPPVPESMRHIIQWAIEFNNPENTTDEFSEKFFIIGGMDMAVWCGYNKKSHIFILDHRDGF